MSSVFGNITYDACWIGKEIERRRVFIAYFFNTFNFLRIDRVSIDTAREIMGSILINSIDTSEQIKEFIHDSVKEYKGQKLRDELRIILSAAFAFMIRGIITDEDAMASHGFLLNKYRDIFQYLNFEFQDENVSFIKYLMYSEFLFENVKLKPVATTLHYAAVLLENHPLKTYGIGGSRFTVETQVRIYLTNLNRDMKKLVE